MTTGGVLLLCTGWWLLRPSGARRADLRLTFFTWVTPLLVAPPILSSDAIAYCDLGWLLDQGQNPYQAGLGTAGGPCSTLIDPFWQGTTTPYPPLGLMILWLGASLGGFDPFFTTLTLRLLMILTWGLCALLVRKLAINFGVAPTSAVWLAILNPLAIVHLIGGAHGDGFMILAVLAGLVLATSSRLAVSVLAASAMGGVAASLKQQAAIAWWAIALIPVDGLPLGSKGLRVWTRVGIRLLATGVLASVTFMLLAAITRLGVGWVDSLDVSARSGSLAPARVLSLLFARSGNDHWSTIASVSQMLGIASALICLFAFPRDPLKGVAWGSFVLFILGSVMHPWYMTFPLALLAVTRLRRMAVWALTLFILWLSTGMVSTRCSPPIRLGQGFT